MKKSAFGRCLALSLAGVIAISASVFAGEAKLVPQGTAKSKQGEKVYRFALTASDDRPVFYIADKDTGIVLHVAEEQRGTKWAAVGKPWCASPSYPMLPRGKTTEITVTAPETSRPWRIGIKLYDRKPARDVKFTEVWSPAVK